MCQKYCSLNLASRKVITKCRQEAYIRLHWDNKHVEKNVYDLLKYVYDLLKNVYDLITNVLPLNDPGFTDVQLENFVYPEHF